MKPYDKFAVKAGDEVWVRAVVMDNCTSCCGVKIATINPESMLLYAKPADVLSLQAAQARIRVLEEACRYAISELEDAERGDKFKPYRPLRELRAALNPSSEITK